MSHATLIADPQTRPPTAARRRPRWRRWLAGALALTVLAELGLRFGLGMCDPVLYRSDAACGYLPAPNQHFRRFFHRNDINALGMRSPEVPAQKDPRELRVLFVGDSVTFGAARYGQSDIFTSLLDRELSAQVGRPVRVLNASTSGWAASNGVGYLKSRGTFDADLVVFALNTGDLMQAFAPSPVDANPRYPSQRPPLALAEAWQRYAWPRLARAAPPADAGSLPAVEVEAATASDAARVREALAEAKAVCDASGSALALVFIPANGEAWSHAGYVRALQALREWAAREGIGFSDLTPVLAALPAQDVYFDHIHLRARGHRAVADAIKTRWGSIAR